MKKRLLALSLMAVLLLGLVPGAAAAGDMVVAMKAGTPWCVIGQELVLLDPDAREVMPVVDGGRTLVPIRRVMEAFGGQVEWVAADSRAVCSLDGNRVEVTLGAAAAQVNGSAVTLEVPARLVGGRTFVPLRFVSENLGLKVGYEKGSGVVIISRTAYDEAALAALSQVKLLQSKSAAVGDPLALRSGSFTLPSGTVKANIITVDMSSPAVSVRMEMVDGTLNRTRNFQDIVGGSGAAAAINGNFFESYNEIKDPIGHVMSRGTFLYGNSGLTSLGITADNQMRWGRPAVFVRVKVSGAAQEWSAYNVNTLEQLVDGSVLYNSARGSSVPATCAGAVMTVENGTVTGYRAVAAGESIAIPQTGFALFMGTDFTTTHYFSAPVVGSQVTLEPYLRVEDPEGFRLEGVTQMVTGAPRLVRGGAIETYLDPGFTEARFTTAVTPRTAVGTTKDGKLLLVNVSSASLQQLRELMLQLGCVEAVNLDGGASTGMYYRGQYLATPGRALTTTLQIFVNG